MICPKCKAEYRQGFYTCADCSIPLVVKPAEIEESQSEILNDLELNSEQCTSHQDNCTTEAISENELPKKCPQCGHNDFLKLKPEEGEIVLLDGIISFFFDLICSYDHHLHTLEAFNRLRSGWMCKNCGKEIRVKPES